ncbi:hypothetical protein JNK13_11600 [bacterium]|nr:hypothetical protein [bacterium]
MKQSTESWAIFGRWSAAALGMLLCATSLSGYLSIPLSLIVASFGITSLYAAIRS